MKKSLFSGNDLRTDHTATVLSNREILYFKTNGRFKGSLHKMDAYRGDMFTDPSVPTLHHRNYWTDFDNIYFEAYAKDKII
jgi:hypothetical protein